MTHENRHEPAAVDHPRHRAARRASSTRSRRSGFDAVEVPIFDTADLAPFERLGKRIKSLGLGATAVTVMGAGDQSDLARSPRSARRPSRTSTA